MEFPVLNLIQFNYLLPTFNYQRRQISFVGLSPGAAAVEANNHANVPIEDDDDDDALEEDEEEEDEDEEELVIASPFAKPELLTCISEENLFENNLEIMVDDRGEPIPPNRNMSSDSSIDLCTACPYKS